MPGTIRAIDVIGVRSSMGAPCAGAELGPEAIRNAGLFDALKSAGYSVNDCGDITADKNEHSINNCGDISGDKKEYPANDCGDVSGGTACCAEGGFCPDAAKKNLKNLEAVLSVNQKAYGKVLGALKKGRFPLALGGDHSVAAGTAAAAAACSAGGCGIIWVDAHGDFNDALSSPSGNIHGMPLSALTGNGPDEILPRAGKVFIKPANAVIIGARALDQEEEVRLMRAGVTVFSMDEVRRQGIDSVTRQALRIACDGTQGFYLTFDIDAVDPSAAPGISTPSSGGLSADETRALCEILAASRKLFGMELVELNPLNDKGGVTAKLAVEIIATLLGGGL